MDDTETNITIQDLALVVSIIDTCVKRGAFEGKELTVVGTLRDKFETVADQNSSNEQETQSENDTEDTE